MNDDGIFHADIAATYDVLHGAPDPAMPPALAALANGGRALEFAIGTGRVALPLRALGVDVAGIELSSAMVDVLRQKETGPAMNIVIGDMTTTQVPGPFLLVYLVYNTIDNLTSQDAQVACFRNAADHLMIGGCFVVETLVPPLQRLPIGETKLAFDRSDTHWGIDEFDVVSQSYASHHVWMKDGVAQRTSAVPFRYAWPAEMDLMARMAGMQLTHRWADWAGSPFTAQSPSHISVWTKTA